MPAYSSQRATICESGPSPTRYFGKFMLEWMAKDWLRSHGWFEDHNGEYALDGTSMKVYVTTIRDTSRTIHLNRLPRTPKRK